MSKRDSEIKVLLMGFGFLEKRDDEISETSRRLALAILEDIRTRYRSIDDEQERKEFVQQVFYDLSVILKYVLYLGGRKEGQFPRKTRWKIDLIRELPLVLDHPRDMGNYLTAHPYTLGLCDLRNLVDICEKRNLELVISGTSEYFPAHTLKVSICQRNVPKGVLLHMHDTFEGEQRGE